MKRVFYVASLAMTLVGCGGPRSGFDQAFTKRWQSDHGDSASKLFERLKGQQASPGAQVAIGVSAQGLVAKGLDNGGSWSYAGNVDTVPQISRNVVGFTSGHQIVLLDAKSGSVLWRIDSDKRRLRGIGDDGTYTAVSLDDANGTQPSDFLIVSREGKELHRYELRAPIGVPAVVAGTAFIPWENQYVSAIDANSGDEVGRILLRHQVSHAQIIGSELYFGQLGLTRFDSSIGAAHRKDAAFVALPTKKLPGNPQWYRDGTVAYAPSDSASTKIHLWARPVPANVESAGAPNDGLAVAGNTYAASYFSVALGLDAKDASLKWTHVLEDDIVGGTAATDGFALCDGSGNVWKVSADGSPPTRMANLGKPLVTCVVQAHTLGVTGSATPPLAAQIEQVLSTHRPSLASAYSFLVEELPQLKDPLVTKILIDLIEHPRTVPSLARRAGVLLAEQRTGVQHMLAALERHYDFLSGNRPPPVGPLAQALEAMGEKEAAPLLAEHLNDPATSVEDVALVAKALHTLATNGQTQELETFFALYRATADQPPLVEAVVKVAQTLVRVGGPTGQAMVEFAATDPLTHPKVRNKLSETLRNKQKKPSAATPPQSKLSRGFDTGR